MENLRQELICYLDNNMIDPDNDYIAELMQICGVEFRSEACGWDLIDND